MFKSNINRLINNSGKLMALFGIMAALAVMLVGAPAASANTSSRGAATDYGKLTVYVSNATTGAQVAKAAVEVYDANSPTVKVVARGTTNERGEFASYVPVGAFNVKVAAEGFSEAWQQTSVKRGQSVQMKVALQATSTDPAVSPVPEGKLSVHVLNGQNGDVAINATVVVYDINGNGITKGVTDSYGYFATVLPAGDYSVKVFADGYQEFSQNAEIVPGEATVIKVALQSTDPAAY